MPRDITLRYHASYKRSSNAWVTAFHAYNFLDWSFRSGKTVRRHLVGLPANVYYSKLISQCDSGR